MIITLPLYVDIPRKKGKAKRVYANLNVYRNLHHVINNDTKHLYKELIWAQLQEMHPITPLVMPIRVTVTLYAPDKRDRDLGNFCSVAQKYADDAVVEYGVLPDDCVKYVKECVYRWGGVDTNHPRFEIEYGSM